MNVEYHNTHYQLFHYQLPNGLHDDLLGLFLESIRLEGVENIIVGLWRGTAKTIRGSFEAIPDELEISTNDVQADVRSITPTNNMVIIKTPEVRGPLEAAYVIVAFNKEDPSDSLRYFTCEAPADEGMPWMLGERTASGAHSNHGVLLDVSKESFIAKVVSILGWELEDNSTSMSTTVDSPSKDSDTVDVHTSTANDAPSSRTTPVPATIRTGKTTVALPPYVADLPDGQLANSGVRGPLRFVTTGQGIGVYAVRDGLRSLKLNRGVLINIDDDIISYRATRLAPRDKTDETSKGLKFGPLLPTNTLDGNKGTFTVTADVQPVSPATRSEIDEIMITRYPVPRPRSLPFIWNYLNRLSNWLMHDSAPVFYQLSGETATAFGDLMPVFRLLGSRGGCYFDLQERYVFGNESNKGNAGASKLLERQPMEVGVGISSHLHLNFNAPYFRFSGGYMYFLPDEVVLVARTGDCTFVPYHAIKYEITEGTQIGVEVPSWCQPVGYSWQFMNKDGSPDRRYSNNMQIPHYRVWELDFILGSTRIDTAFADQNLLQQLIRGIDRLSTLSNKRRIAV